MIWTSISPISRCPPPLGTHLPVGGYDDNIMPILCSTGSLQARPIIVDVPVHNIIWIGHSKQGTSRGSKPQQPPQDAWTDITTCDVSSFTMPNTAWYRWMSGTIKANIISPSPGAVGPRLPSLVCPAPFQGSTGATFGTGPLVQQTGRN